MYSLICFVNIYQSVYHVLNTKPQREQIDMFHVSQGSEGKKRTSQGLERE